MQRQFILRERSAFVVLDDFVKQSFIFFLLDGLVNQSRVCGSIPGGEVFDGFEVTGISNYGCKFF